MPTESLSYIRALYLARFREVLAATPDVHIEPALRTSTGELAVDGDFSLPCRVDLVSRGGGQRFSVDSNRLHSFEPIVADIDGMRVEVSPFAWDNVSVAVSGPPSLESAKALCQWFAAWFDPDDDNPASEDGWYEVVHFMSDPTAFGHTTVVTVDLGSATTSAVEDLFTRLLAVGAKKVQLSQPT
ncbi:hypothetical protein [Rubrivivax albus]|uniref:Uncharacterized protein n=1 Tax=Rubrivivax albus TaxID=2499835 RepID=A0A437JL82_9BURK|nr:hypothetical protein [Rubrivivax albus]RVT47486.1 hypothetical protein ENE75_24075 [Rubrivivax albus]